MESMLRATAVVLHEVRDDLKTVKSHVLPQSESLGADRFPKITTKDALYDFNDQLAEKSVIRKVKKMLVWELSVNVKKSVIGVMNSIATKQVWSQFSHKGQRGKDGFVELHRVNRLVQSVIMEGLKTPPDDKPMLAEINNAIAVYLSEATRKKRSSGNKEDSDDDFE